MISAVLFLNWTQMNTFVWVSKGNVFFFLFFYKSKEDSSVTTPTSFPFRSSVWSCPDVWCLNGMLQNSSHSSNNCTWGLECHSYVLGKISDKRWKDQTLVLDDVNISRRTITSATSCSSLRWDSCRWLRRMCGTFVLLQNTFTPNVYIYVYSLLS